MPSARDVDAILRIHERKTGALFAAAARCGALNCGAGAALSRRLEGVGLAVGTAFQLADDLVDEVGDVRSDRGVNLAHAVGPVRTRELLEARLVEARGLLAGVRRPLELSAFVEHVHDSIPA